MGCKLENEKIAGTQCLSSDGGLCARDKGLLFRACDFCSPFVETDVLHVLHVVDSDRVLSHAVLLLRYLVVRFALRCRCISPAAVASVSIVVLCKLSVLVARS